MRLALRLTLVVAVAFALTAVAPSEDAEHPPHTRAVEGHGITSDYPDYLTAAGRFVDQVLQEIAENERIEQERLAEEARAADLRRSVPAAPTRAASDPSCSGFPDWFPHHIIWRESNCTRGINTGNGYYGAYQVAGFHWNGGICTGLTWLEPASEDECAWRLSAGGTNFRPWGA